jgi:hypothetical protein
LCIASVHGFVQLRQKFQTLIRYSTEDPAAVLGTWSTCHQSFSLEPVDEPGRAGSLLYHPFANGQSRQAAGAGSAQNSQDIVLLGRDSMRLDHLREAALNGVGGPQQAERCLLFA